jgi:hypothetical protein
MVVIAVAAAMIMGKKRHRALPGFHYQTSRGFVLTRPIACRRFRFQTALAQPQLSEAGKYREQGHIIGSMHLIKDRTLLSGNL